MVGIKFFITRNLTLIYSNHNPLLILKISILSLIILKNMNQLKSFGLNINIVFQSLIFKLLVGETMADLFIPRRTLLKRCLGGPFFGKERIGRVIHMLSTMLLL